MIRLTPQELQLVRAILAQHLPGYEVRAFGSRVDGSNSRFSDLDLLVIAPAPIDPVVLGNARDAFSLSDLPFFVDLIDSASIDRQFHDLVMPHAVRF